MNNSPPRQTIDDEFLVQPTAAPVPHIPEAPQAPELSGDVTHGILSGTTTLGIAVIVERGATFAANIMAARFAGASVFGAYSVGISTANNISTYAAGGIGATATRFSGKYPYSGRNYATFARVLAFVSLISAAVAAAALFFGAQPIAHILHKDSLAGLLRWAALSAAGMLVLECARGFFVGQRRLIALTLLSLLVGLGMVLVLPATAAHQSPAAMVTAHGTVTLSAVLLCLLLAKPLGLLARHAVSDIGFLSMLREVWGFGFIQLSGLLSANLAGWWITALVARSDPSLIQMGLFAVASQLRNLTGIIPALLTEGSYAAIATPDVENARIPQRIMALCTFASTAVSFFLAAVGIIVIPWALHALYGPRYASAALASAVGMSVAVLQMGNAPPSARVSVVSIRSVAAINTFWAFLTATAGTLLMLHWGGAAGAMLVFFLAHIVSAILTFIILARKDHLPAGLVPLFILTTLAVAALSGLAFLRESVPHYALPITFAMVLLSAACCFALRALATRHGWLNSLAKLQDYLLSARKTIRRFTRSALGRK